MANIYTEVVTKGYNLPYDYEKLVLDSLNKASQGKVLIKTSQDKKPGTMLYLGAPLLLTRLAYHVIGKTGIPSK